MNPQPFLLCLSLCLGLSATLAPALEQSPAEARKRLVAQLAKLPVIAHFDQAYAGTSDPKQMLDLYLPKERPDDKPLPTIVFIHGGGWKNGDRANAYSSVLRFVQTGRYAGVAVSYRLSGQASWPAQIHDCKAAIRWVRGNARAHGLDPDRIGVWGSSAGGHLVSLLGTSGGVRELEGDLGGFKECDSRVACVVNVCGPQDLTIPLMFQNAQPVTEDPALVDLFGGPLADRRAALVAASPVTYLTSDDPPFLTIHGTKDARVDFRHATRLHEGLKNLGVPSLLIPVTDGPHGSNNPEIGTRIAAFFDRHLRGVDVEVSTDPLPHIPKEPSSK